MGVPGLTLIAPLNFMDDTIKQSPGDLLADAILTAAEPVLFIENKLQYLLPLYSTPEQPELDLFAQPAAAGKLNTPTYLINVKGAPNAQITLTAYGYMAELARQAILKLAYEDEIFADLVVPTRLTPFDTTMLAESVSRSGRLVTIEEGSLSGGWGAEVIARIVEAPSVKLQACARVAARDLPVAAAPSLEAAVLPQLDDLLRKVRKVVRQNE